MNEIMKNSIRIIGIPSITYDKLSNIILFNFSELVILS